MCCGVAAAGSLWLPAGVAADEGPKCLGVQRVVISENPPPIGVMQEFAVYPRELRWKRDVFPVRNGVDPSWDTAVAQCAGLLDDDLTRKSVGFVSGGDGQRRQGEIVVDHDPHLLDHNTLGWCIVWTRDAEPDAIVMARIMMGIAPDHRLFQEVLLHELGHAVGLLHESNLDAEGKPVSIMHPTAITGFQDYAPDDLRGFAKLRYRGDGVTKQRRRRRRRGGRR